MIIVIMYLNLFFQVLSSEELCNRYSVNYQENLKKFRENCDNENYLIVYNKNEIDLNKHKNVQFALISGKDVKNVLYVNELNYLKELYLLNTNVNDLDKIKESINVYVIDKRFYLNNKYKRNITFLDPLLYTPYTTHIDFDDLEMIYNKIYSVYLSKPHSDEPGLTFFKDERYSYNFDLIQFVDKNYILSLNDVMNKNLFGLIKNKLWKYAKYLIEYYEVDLNKTDENNNKTILDYIYEIKNGNDTVFEIVDKVDFIKKRNIDKIILYLRQKGALLNKEKEISNKYLITKGVFNTIKLYFGVYDGIIELKYSYFNNEVIKQIDNFQLTNSIDGLKSSLNDNDVNYYLKIRTEDDTYFYQDITEYSKKYNIIENNSKYHEELSLIKYLKHKYKDINPEYFQIYMQDIRPNNFKHYDDMPLIKYLKNKNINNK